MAFYSFKQGSLLDFFTSHSRYITEKVEMPILRRRIVAVVISEKEFVRFRTHVLNKNTERVMMVMMKDIHHCLCCKIKGYLWKKKTTKLS